VGLSQIKETVNIIKDAIEQNSTQRPQRKAKNAEIAEEFLKFISCFNILER